MTTLPPNVRAVVDAAGNLSVGQLQRLVDVPNDAAHREARRVAFGTATEAADRHELPLTKVWLLAFDRAEKRRRALMRGQLDSMTLFDLSWSGARDEENTPAWAAGRAAVAMLVRDYVDETTFATLYGKFPPIPRPPALPATG